MTRTRIERRQTVGIPRGVDEGWLRSVILVSAALKKDSARELLSCLCEEGEEVASAQLNSVLALPRAARQALLAEEFGCRVDAAEEVKRLRGELTGPLREELLRQLPAFMTSGAPEPSPEPLTPLALKWARRLAREASLTGPRPSKE